MSPKSRADNEAIAAAKPEMIDAHDVASILGCAVVTVRRRSLDGSLPRPTKIGKLCRWPRKAIEQFVAKACEQAGS